MTYLLAGCSVVPAPLTDVEVATQAIDVSRRVTADQEPVSGAIDLYEAMARALKYNLDLRVEEMTAAVRVRELDLAHFSLLPNVVANSGYAGRNNDNASNSVNIFTGVESLATSTSQERRMSNADIAFSWNILDFGLSYVRARQAADKYLIAEEMRRRVITRIIEDVRTAYWRAVSADRLISRLGALEVRIRQARANARATAADRQTSPITAATYERELVEIKRAIQELQRDLSVARTQLAALMNLKPGTRFALAGGSHSRLVSLPMPVSDMISTALQNRSELREVWYQKRINKHELDAALLELLPGLTPYAGTNYDSNDFLYNSHWLSWGAKASWNLIRVFQYPAKREVIEAQEHQLDARSLAVAMAVVTQVHVSRIRFLQFSKELATANEFLSVQRRLLGLMRTQAEADRISEQTLIREEMNTLVAEAKRDIAHAGAQNAFASIYTSMGLAPFAGGLDKNSSVKELASQLRAVWSERGARRLASR
ncbi:MAG: TolC family protein [Hyphomicrobiaceae bacterium]